MQYQVLPTNIIRTAWQTVWRITNEISGMKGLNTPCYHHCRHHHYHLSAKGVLHLHKPKS